MGFPISFQVGFFKRTKFAMNEDDLHTASFVSPTTADKTKGSKESIKASKT